MDYYGLTSGVPMIMSQIALFIGILFMYFANLGDIKMFIGNIGRIVRYEVRAIKMTMWILLSGSFLFILYIVSSEMAPMFIIFDGKFELYPFYYTANFNAMFFSVLHKIICEGKETRVNPYNPPKGWYFVKLTFWITVRYLVCYVFYMMLAK